MALAVAEFVFAEPDRWMRRLPSDELQILEQIADNRPGEKYNAGYEPYVTILEDFGFAKVDHDDCENALYSVDKYMHEAINRGMEDACGYILDHNFLEYEQYVRGALNLYGVIRYDKLMSILYDADLEIEGDVKGQGVLPGHFAYIAESLLIKAGMLDYDSKCYVTHPCIDDTEYFIEEQLSRRQLDYKPYSLDEIIAASVHPPFNNVDIGEPWGEEFLDFLKAHSKDEILDTPDYDYFFVEAQYGTRDFISNAMSEVRLRTFSDAEAFAKILQNFSNHIPHWSLKGWAPLEVFEKVEKPALRPLPKDFSLNPLDFWSERITREAKVGRNDPCPCGSGKKYKDCHGKFRS